MRLTEITKTNRNAMKKLAQDAIDKIQLDASKGVFQNNKSNQQYKSDGYKRYKANNMRGFRTGKKLKAFRNQSTDTHTSYVNMKLTGRTLRSMRPSAKKDVAIITFDRGEIVLGNQERGYDIFGLSNDNMNFIAKRFGEELLDRNIRKYVSKTTVIK